MSERTRQTDRAGETEGVVDEPVTTQKEWPHDAETAEQSQPGGHAATAPGMPPPRAENARQAAGAAGEEAVTEVKRDVAPGGTIETALTESGTASMVASQLLWDGSSATSRIDAVIAGAQNDARDDAADDAGEDGRGETGGASEGR
ncbi:hypothetical protein [Microbispora corallina]|uniref:hypothetical protein n=1 Tax=Microbispora corallina TaxID=83302 RepID=UPI0019522CB6|nr:hypothetical protein [Microbispora corallina]